MILLDLFSGYGGFHLGLEQAGFKFSTTYFSEIDTHAIANYRYNFKNAEYVGPVESISGIQRPNIITFGSPCQDFSLAGKRQGLKGGRSSLLTHAIGHIKRYKPDIFIWENVKGVFSSNDGADFWAVIKAFADIGGYRLEWQLLNTSWFLPQNRERIYLVGHLANGSSKQVFPIGESNKGIIEGKPNTAIARAFTAGGNSGGHHSGMTLVKPIITPDRPVKRQNGRRIKEDGEPAHTLTGQDRHGILITANTKQGFETVEPGDSINFSVPNSETRRGRVGKGKAQTLDTACNQGVISDTQIRRLTEIECERLQGLPDNFTQYGMYDVKGVLTKKEISSTQRYKLCGNGVTVKVVEEIGKRL